MSSTHTSDGGPFYQSFNIDHSHHVASRSYTNHGYHASGQGIINHQTTNYQYSLSNPLEGLWRRCSLKAAFNSAARFDPPRCAESTRLGIIRIIEEWINSDGDNAVPSSLFWLHGGAGVGKSALAQSLSEKCQKKKELAASFFFFRGDAARNNGDHLIPTLVSHLVGTFKEIVPLVEDRIRGNFDLFTKIYQIQFQELLVAPLLALKTKGTLVAHPKLIVIDGLDECENPTVQCELLRVIARAIPQIPYPLRFFVTSRPEAHITDVFDHDHDLQAITVHRYNLSDDPDADMDIRKLLEKEFVEICRVHRLTRYLPHAWPDQKAITSLVDRSSGHFIYVIRYIKSPKHRPDDRLEVILRLRPSQGDRPYAQLDALYALIFQGVESQLEKICVVLGILYFQSRKVGVFRSLYSPDSIEELLEMRAGDLVLLLDPILSLVAIDDLTVRILHKSLFDYLLDFTRGGHLPFDLARVHELVATYILERRVMKYLYSAFLFHGSTLYSNSPLSGDFAYHCRYAYLNDTLKFYLHSLGVLSYHKPVMTTSMTGSNLDVFLEFMTCIWHFFRALSCEVSLNLTSFLSLIYSLNFDTTGQVYGQYMTKCMDYLHPSVPWRTQHHSRGAIAELDNLKRELDKLLMEWKPQNLNPMDVGMVPVSRHGVEQELGVFSAYAEAYFSSDINTLDSSLVFVDHLTHSYNLGFRDDTHGFLILRTYSRHGNRCHQESCVGYPADLVQGAAEYLEIRRDRVPSNNAYSET